MSKLSAMQEAFCQNLIRGMSQTDAYQEAGYKGGRKQLGDNASRLIENDRIQARLAQLREKASQEAVIDLAWLIKSAVELHCLATKDGAYGPAVSALKEIGILTGERVEKRDNTNRNISDVSDLDRAALLAIASGSGAAAKDGREDKPSQLH